jgi:hypothetical protein
MRALIHLLRLLRQASAPAHAIDRTATVHGRSRRDRSSCDRGSCDWPRVQHDAGPCDATGGIRDVLAVHYSIRLFGACG